MYVPYSRGKFKRVSLSVNVFVGSQEFVYNNTGRDRKTVFKDYMKLIRYEVITSAGDTTFCLSLSLSALELAAADDNFPFAKSNFKALLKKKCHKAPVGAEQNSSEIVPQFRVD